jgi:hypothetical protein
MKTKIRNRLRSKSRSGGCGRSPDRATGHRPKVYSWAWLGRETGHNIHSKHAQPCCKRRVARPRSIARTRFVPPMDVTPPAELDAQAGPKEPAVLDCKECGPAEVVVTSSGRGVVFCQLRVVRHAAHRAGSCLVLRAASSQPCTGTLSNVVATPGGGEGWASPLAPGLTAGPHGFSLPLTIRLAPPGGRITRLADSHWSCRRSRLCPRPVVRCRRSARPDLRRLTSDLGFLL